MPKPSLHPLLCFSELWDGILGAERSGQPGTKSILACRRNKTLLKLLREVELEKQISLFFFFFLIKLFHESQKLIQQNGRKTTQQEFEKQFLFVSQGLEQCAALFRAQIMRE